MKQHVSAVRRVLSLALCLLMALALVPTASASAGSKVYQPNPDFGTYKGMREDGVFEFDLTLPAKSTYTYGFYPLLTGYPKIASFHGTQEVKDKSIASFTNQYLSGKSPGTTTAEYKVWRDGELPQLKVVVYITVVPEADYDASVNCGFAFVQPPELEEEPSAAPEQPGTPDKPAPADDACRHVWKTTSTPATCTSQGQTVRTCSECGETEVLSTTPALKHSYVSAVTLPATAEKEGVRTYTCSRCQNTYTEAIPKLAAPAGTGNDNTEDKPEAPSPNTEKDPAAPNRAEGMPGTVAPQTAKESPVTRDPGAVPAATRNINSQNYGSYGNVVRSTLYARADGGYVRVEPYGMGDIIVENYDKNFQILTSKRIPLELDEYGGFYAGAGYNFLIFGQGNGKYSDSKEVIRVVKYSKDWERLDQVSLYGANTKYPFEAGSLRCVEDSGILYVHTCHTMYPSSKDGLNHQASMSFSVRESDMALLYTNYEIGGATYVSHSFNQFIDTDGVNIFSLDHGDAYPRAAVLQRYYQNEPGKLRWEGSVQVQKFSGKTGDNQTYASLGGLSASSTHYLMAGSLGDQTGPGYGKSWNVVLYAVDKNNFSDSGLKTYTLTNYDVRGSSPEGASTPHLVKISDDRFLVMWEIITTSAAESGGGIPCGKIQYVFVDGTGKPAGQTYSANADLSDCQPILAGGKLVWYVTNESVPVFYTIDAASGALAKSGPMAFTDIKGHWCYSYVQAAYAAQLVTGTSDTAYSPENPLTLAEAVTLASRIYAESRGETVPSGGSPWYRNAYDYCVSKGLITESEFPLSAMTRTATRYEMAAILDKAIPAERMDNSVSVPDGRIPDVRESDRYGEIIYRWYRAGIISGDMDGSFNGSRDIKRSEVAKLLCTINRLV